MTQKDSFVQGSATDLARSVRKHLQAAGIDVPHSALRAALLQASGKHPHATPNESDRPASGALTATQARVQALQALVAEASHYFHPSYDFDGKKLAWLEKAGLAKPTTRAVGLAESDDSHGSDDSSRHARSGRRTLSRTLHLVPDVQHPSALRLALDPQGFLRLPLGAMGDDSIQLTQLDVCSNLAAVDAFADQPVREHLAALGLDSRTLEAGTLAESQGTEVARLRVQIRESAWHALLGDLLDRAQGGLSDEVAEWVGLHYAKNFETESASAQAQWLERFIEAGLAWVYPLPDEMLACLEWVYPDEDSGHSLAWLNTMSGVVWPASAVPDDAPSPLTHVRLWLGGPDLGGGVGPGEGAVFELHDFSRRGNIKTWQLSGRDRKAVNKVLAERKPD